MKKCTQYFMLAAYYLGVLVACIALVVDICYFGNRSLLTIIALVSFLLQRIARSYLNHFSDEIWSIDL